MTTKLKTVHWHDDGNCDIGGILKNIETVRDAVDESDRLMQSAAEDIASMYPPSMSYVIEGRGDHIALGKTIRAEMKLTQVFITAGTDGSDGLDTQITILMNGTDPLCAPVTLKSSEGRGKVVIGTVLSYPVISRFDEITIRSDSDRRMVVTTNFGGV